ncbi:hypothetical protein Tdes44962_MAKER01461 [Teratosphaeria destructans]|uniref:Uncharacterized protein n=1 Tax=Teratosphaeria destructans TaxID=418781 RepID=A0A9W7W5W0_9PEZI|nr:hypothetical protein Tdes44962_MAKER01461 [Teratosphaeria destructans]
MAERPAADAHSPYLKQRQALLKRDIQWRSTTDRYSESAAAFRVLRRTRWNEAMLQERLILMRM